MKKLFPMLLSALFLTHITFSQGKSGEAHNSKPAKDNSNAPSIEKSDETTEYSSRVYNECAGEWVNLNGQVTYSVKEMRSANRYFIMYKIDLRKITGKGETSGDLYKGGGVIMNKVNANFRNGHTVGKDTYNVRYRSPNSNFSIIENAHFNSANADKKVTFDDKGAGCK